MSQRTRSLPRQGTHGVPCEDRCVGCYNRVRMACHATTDALGMRCNREWPAMQGRRLAFYAMVGNGQHVTTTSDLLSGDQGQSTTTMLQLLQICRTPTTDARPPKKKADMAWQRGKRIVRQELIISQRGTAELRPPRARAATAPTAPPISQASLVNCSPGRGCT